MSLVNMWRQTKDENTAEERPLFRRQASLQSAFFSLPTTCKLFREHNFKPTKMVGVLFLDEGQPEVSVIRSLILDKLLRDFPRFCSNVTMEDDQNVMFNEISIKDIDLDYHFKVIDGDGTFTEEEDLSEMVSEAHLMDWDETKPLWQLTLVTNMKDGRSMLFFVLDHTIGDGTVISAIVISLFDKDRLENPIINEKKKRKKKATLNLPVRITAFLYACYTGVIGYAFIYTDPDNSLKFPVQKKRAEPLGKKCCQTRHFPLEELKAIKNKLPGATINDIVTAITTIAIRRYFEKTSDEVLTDHRRRAIHLTFAVNYRHPSTTLEHLIAEGGGNRIVMGKLQVPLTFRCPIDAVWRCKLRMDIYKTTLLVPLLWHVTSFVMKSLPWEKLEEPALDAFFKPTGCISNVIGPSYQASIGGYAVDDFSFYGVAPWQGTYLGVISYNNRVRMYTCMDKHIDANPKEFSNCLEDAYDELKLATAKASPKALSEPRIIRWLAMTMEVAGLALLVSTLYAGWRITRSK